MLFKVGLIKPSAVLKNILRQLGLSTVVCTTDTALQPIPLIISESEKADPLLLDYVKEGGILLDLTGSHVREFTSHSIRHKYIVSMTTQNLPFPHEKEQLDLFEWVKTVNGNILSVHTLQKGLIGHFGIPLKKTFLSTLPLRKQFSTPYRRNPSEELSLKSKGGVSRLFEAFLKELCFRKGYPYMHKAHYEDIKPPLLFRIDSDYTTKERVKNWYKLTSERGIRTTWFLHTEAHESWLELFKEFSNDEISLHCYRHLSKNSAEDIQRGFRLMKNSGITPLGYVAPYGIWSPMIASESAALELNYSSEFELLYDSLPFPSFPGKLTDNHIQIPIHPVCMNSYYTSAATA